jgi:MFS family permease
MNEYIIARRCLAMHNIFDTSGQICGADDVSESAQNWSTWTMLSCNLPSLLVVLPLGRLADEWGRRKVLLWCLGTQVFGSLGMLLVCLFRLDLIWMVPTYIVNGFGGGSYTLQSILMATLVDCATTRQHRSQLLATMTATYYACGCVGPLIGGYMSKANVTILSNYHGAQYQLAYVIFFVTNAMLLVLAICFCKETLPQCSKECNEGVVTVFLKALAPLRLRQVRVLSIVFCLLYATINIGVSGLIVAYAKLALFGMSDELVGVFLAVPWLLRALSAAVIFPLLLRYFSSSTTGSLEQPMLSKSKVGEGPRMDAANTKHHSSLSQKSVQSASIYVVRLGATLSMVVFALFGLATTTPILFLLCSIEGLAAMWDSACSILFSSLGSDAVDAVHTRIDGYDGVDGNDDDATVALNQGSMMGLRALLQTSMACLGPFVFNWVYTETLGWVRPFAFYVLSGCCGLALAVSFCWRH